MRLTDSLNVKKPRRLQPGGTIGLVAPSSQINPDKLGRFIKWITKKGYDVVLGDTVATMQDDDYTSADALTRANEFNAMVNDPSIDVIWAACGGFGAQEVAPLIDYDAVSNDPKPIIGLSDTTFLLNAITGRTGVITFLGSTAEMGPDESDELSMEYALATLTGELDKGTVLPLDDTLVRRVGNTERVVIGRLCGGNLTMMATMIGTDFHPDTTDKILMLEDVGENSYGIERTIVHLESAGLLRGASGVILGEFTATGTTTEDGTLEAIPSVNEVLKKKFSNIGKPVLYGYTFSHGKYNITLPIGGLARLDSANLKLQIIESPVE